MVRRGTYGQTPSAAPTLTNSIIAIARAMQADRQSNLMNAYKNGGTFEGKPVTDEMVLAFWNEQLKGVDKRDPQYDTFKNTIDQTTYSIAESKMSTWYAQSKGGPKDDRHMAAFYSTWSNKIPKDSEFYRVLQRDAAQFIRAAIAKEKVLADAAARGHGGGGGGGPTKAQLKAKAYADSQTATYLQHEQVGAFLTNTLTTVAKGRGLIGIADSKDLTDFDPNDPTALLGVIDQINNNPKDTVYYTAQGAITGQAILDVVKQLDPHFDGKLTTDYYANALKDQVVGQQARLALATSTTHKADMTAIKKQIGATTELGRESNAWGIEQSYQQLRSNFLSTWQDPTATPDQKVSAWKTYSAGLTGLATSKTRPPDDNTYSRLVAEITGDGSVDSLAENFTGLTAGDHSSLTGGSQGDIADTHGSLQGLFAQQQAVASGQAVWAMGTTGSDGAFHPGAGNEIGAANQADVVAASPENAIRVWVTQAGEKPIPVWVSGKPVTATVTDADGFKVGSTNPDSTKVATAYDVSIDGQQTRIYAYQSANGVTMYTTDAPWGANVQSHDTGSGVQLTVKLSDIPSEATVGKDSNYTIIYNDDGRDVRNPDGTITKNKGATVKSITVDPGRLVLTETDPVRHNAGPDPYVDSMSPSIAYYLGSNETRTELAGLSKDSGFAHSVDMDLRLAAGGQYDPTTGYIVGGDPALYNEGAAQAGFSYRMNDPRTIGQGPAGGELFFGRSSTRGAFEVAPPGPIDTPAPVTTGVGASGNPFNAQASTQLPSDAARGTAFDGLAGIFEPGTNRRAATAPVAQDSIVIRGPQQLRVPSVPSPSADTKVTPVPAPLPVQPPMPVPAPLPTPPGPTDSLTPIPVAPLPMPTPAAAGGFGSQDTVASGVTYTAPKPAASPKPRTGATQPHPAAPRTGSRPI